jgi:hypothetical protein
MRRQEDPVMKAIREADPSAGTDASDWAKGEDAAAIAERIREQGDRPSAPTPRPRMTRRVVILIAALVVVAMVVAATIAVRSGTPTTTSLVGCYQELDVGSSVFFAPVRPGVGPVAACRTGWVDAYGAEVPGRLVACVESQGGLVVYPLSGGLSESDACSTVGDALYQPADGDR